MPPAQPSPERDPIYRVIRWMMAADMAIGVALALFGGLIFGTASIRWAGVALAAIGAALFLLLGRLARARR